MLRYCAACRGWALRDWWLTSGCLFQTVWNVRSGRRPGAGILDYDVFYFDEDLSWEAEDRAITAANALFADLGVSVQLRNQARVHLWYETKFGIAYARLRSARHAVRRFPCRASAVAVTMLDDGQIAFYAPYGLRDSLHMTIKPNRWLPIPDVYTAKTTRWRQEWPNLTVEPWSARNSEGGM
jgi:uncharacterized protein